MERKINEYLVVECYYTAEKSAYRSRIVTVRHGGDIVGRNYIAVMVGTLHTKGICRWCDELRTRCSSRRVY